MANCTQIDDELLLQRVSNYNPLFDKRHCDYKSHTKKESCWHEVAASMKLPVPTVKARYKSLREKYRREIELENKLTRNGAGYSSRKEWPLLSFFKYMMEGSEPRVTNTNVPALESLTDEAELESQQTIISGCYALNDEVEEPSYTQNYIQMTTPSMSQHSTPSAACSIQRRNMKRKRLKETATDKTTGLSSVLTAISELIKNPAKEGKISTFCAYMTSELESMPTEESEIFMDQVMTSLLKRKAELREIRTKRAIH